MAFGASRSAAKARAMSRIAICSQVSAKNAATVSICIGFSPTHKGLELGLRQNRLIRPLWGTLSLPELDCSWISQIARARFDMFLIHASGFPDNARSV